MVSDRRSAGWIRRPVRDRTQMYFYQKSSGALFRGGPPSITSGDSVFTSSSFVAEAPLKVYFDFTNKCNLACRHCITSSSPDVDTTGELAGSRIIQLVNEMASMGVLELATGGGEPLLHPEWESLFDAVRHADLNLIITTNGLRLTPTRVEKLSDARPLEVRVSFDGGPELHEQVRGANTYRAALRGLALLIKKGMRATARLTLCRGAERELSTLFSDLANVGVRQCKVAVIKRSGRAATTAGADLLTSLPSSQDMDTLTQMARPFGIELQFSSDDFPITAIDGADPKLRDAETHNCGAGLDTCHITPTGQILGCVAIPGLGFGNLGSQTFREVWGGRVAREYRQWADGEGTGRLCDARHTIAANSAIMAPSKGATPVEILRRKPGSA